MRVGGRSEPAEQRLPGAAVVLLPAEKEAELGVPAPVVRIGRVGLQRFLPRDPRLGRPSHQNQGGSEATLGGLMIRVERDGLLVLAEGLGMPALDVEPIAEEGTEAGG